jgi:amidase
VSALQGSTRDLADWWDGGFDLLLTPTLGEPPLPLGTFAAQPDNPLHGFFRAAQFVPFTVQFNITGQPAISLPLSWNADGLPIGSQLVAAYGREDVLLRVAAQLEQARPWADRRPPVHA